MFEILRLLLGTIALVLAEVSFSKIWRSDSNSRSSSGGIPTKTQFAHKLFWISARQLWSDWKQSLVLVLPETVVQWHRAGFRLYLAGSLQNSTPPLRQATNLERDSQLDIPDGGRESHVGSTSDPWRIAHVRVRCLRAHHLPLDEARPERSRTRKTLARLPPQSSGSHRRDGFLTVPTLTFSVLYCFFVISHDRRRILYFNVTWHPTSTWIIQQLRETFPYDSLAKFLIFDRDAKYGTEIPAALRSMKIHAVRTSRESPWQSGVAERWVESCRRDLLDHIIALDECHLRRLLSEYVRYYHDDRTHLGLGKGTPNNRARCAPSGHIVSCPRLGGLHHRYDRAA